jgi:hypothetical protein
MHTVELLDEALAAARSLGFRVREEWLGGSGGGACTLRGQKWLFLDVALDTSERLDVVVQALSADPAAWELNVSKTLRALLRVRKSA